MLLTREQDNRVVREILTFSVPVAPAKLNVKMSLTFLLFPFNQKSPTSIETRFLPFAFPSHVRY